MMMMMISIVLPLDLHSFHNILQQAMTSKTTTKQNRTSKVSKDDLVPIFSIHE
jgi:hypothetical protein